MIDFSRNHFDLFGLPPAFRVDAAVLDRAYRQLQSDVHPDRFAGGSDAEKRVALQSSARVNEAYRTLKNPVQRAQYLLRLHGVDTVGETDTALPLSFLERQLERREQAADAQADGDVRTLSSLLAEARAESAELEARTGATAGRRPRVRGGAHAGARADVPVQARRRHRRDAGGGRILMALFQISEPGESPAPHQRKRAVGIDLGTTNSLVATVRNGLAVVLPDVEGRPLVPSIVRYGEHGVETGYARWRTRPTIRRTRSSPSSA